MRKELGLTLVNLIDPGSATIRAYGLLNEKQGKIPHPATLVIDRRGIVRYIQVNENHKVRPPAEELLRVLEGLEDREEQP